MYQKGVRSRPKMLKTKGKFAKRPGALENTFWFWSTEKLLIQIRSSIWYIYMNSDQIRTEKKNHVLICNNRNRGQVDKPYLINQLLFYGIIHLVIIIKPQVQFIWILLMWQFCLSLLSLSPHSKHEMCLHRHRTALNGLMRHIWHYSALGDRTSIAEIGFQIPMKIHLEIPIRIQSLEICTLSFTPRVSKVLYP